MPHANAFIRKEYSHLYYLRNKERIKAYSKDYYRNHREQHYQSTLNWLSRNPNVAKESRKRSYKKHREVRNLLKKEFYKNLTKSEKEKRRKQCRVYYWKHRNTILKRLREYQSNLTREQKNKKNKKERERYQNNKDRINFERRLKRSLKRRLK